MDAPAGARYAYSLYWAIAIIETIGYGDISPSQPSTVFALLIVMLVGVFVYSYLMGNVTSIVNLFDGLEAKSKEARDEVRAALLKLMLHLISRSAFPTFMSFVPLSFKQNCCCLLIPARIRCNGSTTAKKCHRISLKDLTSGSC